MKSNSLPAGFDDLAPFVAAWALGHEKARHLRLLETSIAELRRFYDAMLPRYPAIVAYLNRFPLDALPEDAQRLFDLARTFVETAHPIDLNWRTTNIEDSFPADRLLYMPPSGSDQP